MVVVVVTLGGDVNDAAVLRVADRARGSLEARSLGGLVRHPEGVGVHVVAGVRHVDVVLGSPVKRAGHVLGVEGAGLVRGLDRDDRRAGGDAVHAVRVVRGGNSAGGVSDGVGLGRGGLRLFGAHLGAGDRLVAGGANRLVGNAGVNEALAERRGVGGLRRLDEEGVEFGVLGQDHAVFRGLGDGRVEVVAGGVVGQVDRVVHDLVLGASLGGDPRDAGCVGGAPNAVSVTPTASAAPPAMRVLHER